MKSTSKSFLPNVVPAKIFMPVLLSMFLFIGTFFGYILPKVEDHLMDGDNWVADSGVICGCAGLTAEPNGRSGEIHTFFIDPDCQRQGIGRLLWRKLAERANDAGLARLYLDADPAAVPFYRAMGFEVTGAAPSGSIPGRSLPRMTLVLDRPGRP